VGGRGVTVAVGGTTVKVGVVGCTVMGVNVGRAGGGAADLKVHEIRENASKWIIDLRQIDKILFKNLLPHKVQAIVF
jgi:hypothetical protein